MSDKSRTVSEKEFHNARFGPGGSLGSRKYYLALERWYEHYRSEIMSERVGAVLEVGAGMESIALQAEQCPFELLSVDISEEAVGFMNRNHSRNQVRFEVQDAHDMSFADSSFDAVIGRGILHHLNIPVACAEIKRVLKQGGKVVFGEPLDGNVLIKLYRRLTPKIRTKDERPLSGGDLAILNKYFGPLVVTYYGFLTLGPALFGARSPPVIHELDNVILNKLGLGRFLAWACILSNGTRDE